MKWIFKFPRKLLVFSRTRTVFFIRADQFCLQAKHVAEICVSNH